MRRGLFSERALEKLRTAVARVDTLVAGWETRGRSYRIDGLRFRDVGSTTLQYEHGEPRQVARLPRVVEPAHCLDPELDAVVDDPRLVTAARALVGNAHLSLFTDKLNFKRPRFGSAFRWHQDAPYWAHRPGVWARIDRLPNVLIQLDASDESNGCFCVFAGSHREGALPGMRDGSALGPLFTDPAHLDPAAKRPLALPAGSAVFFHARLVHGSGRNRSKRPRRAYVITYQDAGQRMFKLDRVRAVAPPASVEALL